MYKYFAQLFYLLEIFCKKNSNNFKFYCWYCFKIHLNNNITRKKKESFKKIVQCPFKNTIALISFSHEYSSGISGEGCRESWAKMTGGKGQKQLKKASFLLMDGFMEV